METNTHKQSSEEDSFIDNFKADMNNKLDLCLEELFKDYDEPTKT